ncbi:MAG: MCE family protein [Jatrophihabitans sp.]|uniref:MCE family protein n=1 Tax=Jatrophihabitans sp. TaxID=1932789 RepID=UPI003F7DC1C8
MRPLRERNQLMVGLVGTLVAVALVLLAVNLSSLPFVHPTDDYHAQFANAAGLKEGDDVRVLGVPVGSVDAVVVEGDHVRVDFSLDAGVHLGDASSASIEVATVLGNLFLQIESAGSGQLADGGTIPLRRTTVPYSLVQALQSFAEFGDGTRTTQLATSLRTLARSIEGIAPADAAAALRGLTSVARTLAAKQDRIQQILDASNAIVDTLNANSGPLVQLVLQGDAFLQLVEQRRAIITSLLRDTASLAQQLDTLVRRDGGHLTSLLRSVDTLSTLLARDRTKLQRAVLVLGQFSVNIANATGSGPWLDLYVPAAVTPDSQIAACGAHPDSSTRPCGD